VEIYIIGGDQGGRFALPGVTLPICLLARRKNHVKGRLWRIPFGSCTIVCVRIDEPDPTIYTLASATWIVPFSGLQPYAQQTTAPSTTSVSERPYLEETQLHPRENWVLHRRENWVSRGRSTPSFQPQSGIRVGYTTHPEPNSFLPFNTTRYISSFNKKIRQTRRIAPLNNTRRAFFPFLRQDGRHVATTVCR
jgi:hypothetical protein